MNISSDPRARRKHIALATTLIVAGLLLTVTGLYIGNGGTILADTEPPVPAEPTNLMPPTPVDPLLVPPSPDDPTQPADFLFPTGWSMVSGQRLKGRNLSELTKAGILLYSFNDPYYPVSDWTIFPGLAADDATKIMLKPISPLGYYVFNPSDEISITLAPSVGEITDKIFGRGWHLFSWNAQNSMTKDELLGQIKISYSDNSTLTGAQAISSDNHRASVKIYVVVNEHDIDFNKSVKELTNQDTNTTVSKLPKNSYYWLYLRRTRDRVNAFGYQNATAEPSVTVTTSGSPTTEILPPVPAIPPAN